MKFLFLLIYIFIIFLGSFLGVSVFSSNIAIYMTGFIAGNISFVFLKSYLNCIGD